MRRRHFEFDRLEFPGERYTGQNQRAEALVEEQRTQGVLFGDAAGERQRLCTRRCIAHPPRGRRQRLVGQQRQQAGVGGFDRIAQRASANPVPK
jgi:hypothetical protein